MATTKEDLKKRVFDLKESWFDEITNANDPHTHFEKMVDKCINMLDLKKCEDNYIPAHIIFATILEKYAYAHKCGSAFEDKRREHSRRVNKLKKQICLS
jgi:hypothetical protein